MNIFHYGPPTGTPLLWLHGWLGAGAEGEILQVHLGPEYCLICPDLPGHGDSLLQDQSMTETLEQIAVLAKDAIGAIGYSLGGRLLMMAAARHPSAFTNLVIESAHPGLQSSREKSDRRKLDQERAAALRNEGLNRFCQSWYQAPMWGDGEPPSREGDADQLAGALERFSLAGQPDLRPWLRTARNRILWLAGSKDQAYVDHASWVRSNTSHSVEVLDAGHNVHLQRPHEWAEILKQFIKHKRQHEEQR